VYAHSKPRLRINIHHYASPIGSTAPIGGVATLLAAAGRCDVGEGSMSSFKSIT